MILPEEYKYITDRIGEAHAQSRPMVDNMFSMKQNLENGQVKDDFFKEQLLTFIDDVYFSILDNHVNPRKIVLDVTLTMQELIADNNGNVNPYLQSNGILVNDSFAELSNLVGFVIDSENIE